MGSDGPDTCDIGTNLSPGTPANIAGDGMVRLARTPDTPARIPTGFRLGPGGALQVPASPEVLARCNTRIGSPPEGLTAPYWPPEPGRRVMYPDRGTNTGFYGIPATPGNRMVWFPGEPEAGWHLAEFDVRARALFIRTKNAIRQTPMSWNELVNRRIYVEHSYELLDQLMAVLRQQRRGPRPVGSEVGGYDRDGKWVPVMFSNQTIPDLSILRAPYKTPTEAGFPPSGILLTDLSGSESPGSESPGSEPPPNARNRFGKLRTVEEELAWLLEEEEEDDLNSRVGMLLSTTNELQLDENPESNPSNPEKGCEEQEIPTPSPPHKKAKAQPPIPVGSARAFARATVLAAQMRGPPDKVNDAVGEVTSTKSQSAAEPKFPI